MPLSASTQALGSGCATPADAPRPRSWQVALGSKLAERGVETSAPQGMRFEAGVLLGEGANGQVLGVLDRNLGRDLAMKVMHRGLDHIALERFLTEARILAGLSHPNVLPVHDLDLDEQGQLFFTMTRIQGRSLGSAIEVSTPLVRDRRIQTTNDVVNVLLGVARALAYAHHQGLIHQDIKPDNILIGDFGEVLLVDWGSAVRLEHGRTTHLYGTPLYMSPEQARREYADARSDIYSLGATLFHTLTLRLPTWRDDPGEFMDWKCQGRITPPSAEERDRLPPALLDIALMALDPDPSRRYQDAEAMLRDLERFQAGMATLAHQESWLQQLWRWYRGNARLFWAALVAVVAIVAVAGVVLVQRAQERSTWHEVLNEPFDESALDQLSKRWKGRIRGRSDFTSPFTDVPITDVRFFRPGRDGLVVNATDDAVDLTCRTGLSGDLRVDWEVMAQASARNLNCFIGGEDRTAGFTFHVGGFGDSGLVVLTRGEGVHLAHARLASPLTVGHRYHLTLEHVGRHLGLLVDGRPAIAYQDDEAIGTSSPQQFGFDSFPVNNVVISQLKVESRIPAQKVSALEIGDTLYQLHHWEEAEARYQALIDAYDGSAITVDARYRIACCERQLDHLERAEALFRSFAEAQPTSELAPFALAQQLDLALLRHDAGTCAALRERLKAYAGHPVLVRVLMDISQECCEPIKPLWNKTFDQPNYPADIDQRIDRALQTMHTWSAAYQTPLLFDAVSTQASQAYRYLGETQRMLAVQDSSDNHFGGLLDSGSFDQLIAECGVSAEAVPALLAVGRMLEVADNPHIIRADRELASFLMGDGPRLARLDPDCDYAWMQELEEGRFERYLQAHPVDDRGPDFGFTLRAGVLIASGRIEQVLREYKHDSPRARALLALGRLDEALAQAAYDVPLVGLGAFGDREAGRGAAALDLADRLGRSQFNHEDRTSGFPARLLGPLLHALGGDRAAAIARLRQVAEQEKDCLGQRLAYTARYLAGDIDDRAFLAQPFHLMADTRLLMAQGLRHDLRGDAPGAVACYRQVMAMPYYRTLISEVEWAFMAWRCRIAGATVPKGWPLPILIP